MRRINKQNCYCKCSRLETVENILKERSLNPAEQVLLRKVFPEFYPRIIGTKKDLRLIVKFLDSLLQLLCP